MWQWLQRKLTGKYYVEMLRKVSDEEVLTVRFHGRDPDDTVELINMFLSAMQRHALDFNAKLATNTTLAQERARETYQREHANGPVS